MTRFVESVCRAKDHQQLPLWEAKEPWAPNPVTFRERTWAYCPSGRPDGHEWERVDPRPYETLREETEREIAGSRQR